MIIRHHKLLAYDTISAENWFRSIEEGSSKLQKLGRVFSLSFSASMRLSEE
jgi:hypothetical protein